MCRDDGYLAIEEFLCTQCVDALTGIFLKEKLIEKRKQVEEKAAEEKQPKDIYQMERESHQKEKNIIESLSPEKQKEFWALIISVQELADGRAQSVVSDWVEQGLLFNILMSESWQAAELFDPSHGTKFSTWAYNRWTWAIFKFLRAKRLYTQSLSDPIGLDGGSPVTLEECLSDTKIPSPLELAESKEWALWTKTIFAMQPLMKTMIEDVCQHYEWLCPFCRRVLRAHFLGCTSIETEDVILTQWSAQNVYARRALWVGCLTCT